MQVLKEKFVYRSHPDIDTYKKIIESELRSILCQGKDNVQDIISYLLKSPGKRLRPILTLLSAFCVTSTSDVSKIAGDTITTAAAAEIIHMASLVHDDIVDESNFRRYKPTINSIYGNHTAVLAGDYLFTKAFEILSPPGLSGIMGIMLKSIQDMCRGEIEQAQNRYNTQVTREQYFKRIYNKTASLLSACCKCGALSAGADNLQAEYFSEFGKYLGYIFQITDDILDFTGSDRTLGKPSCSDLSNGYITLPYIVSIEQNPQIRLYIEEYYNHSLSAPSLNDLFKLIKESGCLEITDKIAGDYKNAALDSLAGIPHSSFLDILFTLPERILSRNH